jgi:hypothetical protein
MWPRFGTAGFSYTPIPTAKNDRKLPDTVPLSNLPANSYKHPNFPPNGLRRGLKQGAGLLTLTRVNTNDEKELVKRQEKHLQDRNNDQSINGSGYPAGTGFRIRLMKYFGGDRTTENTAAIMTRIHIFSISIAIENEVKSLFRGAVISDEMMMYIEKSIKNGKPVSSVKKREVAHELMHGFLWEKSSMHGITSTSTDPEIAENYLNYRRQADPTGCPVMITIQAHGRTRHNKPARGVTTKENVFPIWQKKSYAAEVVLDHASNYYEISEFSKRNGRIHITVDAYGLRNWNEPPKARKVDSQLWTPENGDAVLNFIPRGRTNLISGERLVPENEFNSDDERELVEKQNDVLEKLNNTGQRDNNNVRIGTAHLLRMRKYFVSDSIATQNKINLNMLKNSVQIFSISICNPNETKDVFRGGVISLTKIALIQRHLALRDTSHANSFNSAGYLVQAQKIAYELIHGMREDSPTLTSVSTYRQKAIDFMDKRSQESILAGISSIEYPMMLVINAYGATDNRRGAKALTARENVVPKKTGLLANQPRTENASEHELLLDQKSNNYIILSLEKIISNTNHYGFFYRINVMAEGKIK